MTLAPITLVSPDLAHKVTDSTLFDWKTSAQDLPGEWSVNQRLLRGGRSEGVHVVELSNGVLSVSVLPTRGMGIWKAALRGISVGWDSPVKQPVHPHYVNFEARNGLGWLEGFNELLCRCGLSSVGPPGIDHGAASPIDSELTLHGRIANTPAHSVEVGVDADAKSIWIRGVCDEACMFGPQLRLTSQLTLPIGGRSFTIRDEIQNLASDNSEFELLYHINVGPPFLEKGSRCEVPFDAMSPRDPRAAEGVEHFSTCLGPTAGYEEQVYLFEPRSDAEKRSTALLANAARDRGLSVEFDTSRLPCFTLWKCTQSEADGYVAGLEPGTNFPNFRGFEREQSRVKRLGPGESFVSEMTLSVHDSEDAVRSVSESIASLQNGHDPQIYSAPSLPFTPAE